MEDFDDDASQFTTASINSLPEGDISNHRGALAGAEQNDEDSDKHDENSVNSQNLRPCNASAALFRESVPGIPELPPLPPILRETNPSATTATTTSIPKGRSIAHHDMARKGTAYVSFDIETGGEYCGILQLSAEVVRVELQPVETKKGPSATIDYASLVSREALTFNRFVKPGEGAIWNNNVTSIHRLHQNHPSIIGADDMDTVWEQFVCWYDENTRSGEVAILVAYNGGT